MSRNRERLGGTQDKNTSATMPVAQDNGGGDSFSFVVPTDFVELPSKGKYYPEGHALHNEETIEIRQMTAKEEDILTSRSLLKKGLAIDRLIKNLIVDKGINADQLLTGDRNAIVVAARIAAYGSHYETKVVCPACTVPQVYTFNLSDDSETYEGKTSEDIEASDNGDGTFNVELPVTGLTVTFRLLRGFDEKQLIKAAVSRKTNKNNGLENNITTQLSNIIVSVNGDSSPQAINYLVENIPSMDSRHLRFVHRMATPNVELAQVFTCEECEFTQEMEVPLTADFFWPKR